LWGLTFFGLVIRAVDQEVRVGWSTHRLARWLGGVGVFSYSLYLIHYLVRSVLKQFLIRVFPALTWPLFWISAGILGLAGYYAGRLLFAAVERRFISQPLDAVREVQIPLARAGADYAGA
jgi:peptidoglycan/LPS O-acetylase OafA/YrhL